MPQRKNENNLCENDSTKYQRLKNSHKNPKTYRKARKIVSSHSCPEFQQFLAHTCFSVVDCVLCSCIRLPYF